jgi:hypothetical protein
LKSPAREGRDRLHLAVRIDRPEVLDAHAVAEAARLAARELAAPAAEVAVEEERGRVVGGAEHLVRAGREEDGVEGVGAVDPVGRARVVGAHPERQAEGLERLAAVVAPVAGDDVADEAVAAPAVESLRELLRAVAERVGAREQPAGARPDAVVAHLHPGEEQARVERPEAVAQEVGLELDVQHVGELGQIPVVRGVEVAGDPAQLQLVVAVQLDPAVQGFDGARGGGERAPRGDQDPERQPLQRIAATSHPPLPGVPGSLCPRRSRVDEERRAPAGQ